jgi:dsRNA-specific ribonuclease
MDTPAYNAIIMGAAMEQSGFAPGDDFILGLMKHKILGILPSDLDQKAHLEFLHRAEQLGIPIPKFYRAS